MPNDFNVMNEPIGNPICLHCAAELVGRTHFCPECGCPVTPEAASMPYESVLARGFLAREASSKPRKLIVVLGMWLMMLPAFLIFSLGFVVMFLSLLGFLGPTNRNRDIPGSVFGMIVSAAIASITGTLLYKTTRNYLKQRSASRDELEDDEDGESGLEQLQ
jgi:hypothetical protein